MAETSNTSPAHSSSWNVVEGFGTFASLITATLLVLSTAYDFSFLYALGLSFEELPSTLADHVRSAIVWAPRALLYVAALLMYEMFMRRVERGMSEEELIARSPTPRFTRAFRNSPKIAFGILIPLIVGLDFVFGTSDYALFLVALVGWGFLAGSVVEHPRLGARFTSTTGRLFVTVPIVVIWVASLGYGRGESLMKATIPTWKVELKGTAGSETRMLVGLRRFSTAAVLVEPGRGVSIVPADSVVHADALRAPEADTPRSCNWLGISCTSPLAKP